MKTILATMCVVAIGIAIPHGRIAAQQLDNLPQQFQRQQQLESARRQWDQEHQGQTMMLDVLIVNANTFEEIVSMVLIAHGVIDLDEARWNIRRQLGFPEASDLRTVGGVPQRIIWGAWMGGGVQYYLLPPHPGQNPHEFTHLPEVQQIPAVPQMPVGPQVPSLLPLWRR